MASMATVNLAFMSILFYHDPCYGIFEFRTLLLYFIHDFVEIYPSFLLSIYLSIIDSTASMSRCEDTETASEHHFIRI